jgi:hypothetical protein
MARRDRIEVAFATVSCDCGAGQGAAKTRSLRRLRAWEGYVI